MIFIDTGAWFASVVPWDANHAAASDWLRRNREPLVNRITSSMRRGGRGSG
jgi:hypothetical protein